MKVLFGTNTEILGTHTVDKYIHIKDRYGLNGDKPGHIENTNCNVDDKYDHIGVYFCILGTNSVI